ncbi:MAG: LysR family transcriptional regulator [Pseudomonadota bacterium]
MSSAHYNLARFDLVSIRLAVACVQTGSLTAAAHDSNLALAAASRRIRELESALGDKLFERHPRGLLPTPAGRVFAKHGLNLLQSMEQLGGELADLRLGIARHIRLCASSAAISEFLPPLLVRYGELYPQIRLDLEEQVSHLVVSTLKEGRADVAVFVEGPDTTGLQTAVFRHDELVVVLPATHRLARGKKPLAFADLLDEEWISLTTGAAVLQKQQEAALAAKRPLKLRMQVRSFDAVCNLVASGLGIAILPKGAGLSTQPSARLCRRPLADSWAQRRLLVAVAEGQRDPAIAALVDFLVQPSQNAKPVRPRK